MAVKKKELLIEYELDFLDSKLEELKAYIIANPFDKLEDRIRWKEMKNGGTMPIVIASKEAQRKDLAQALKDYAEILITVKGLREKEDVKKTSARGNTDLSPLEEGDLQ